MILYTLPSSPFGARIAIQAAEKGLSLEIAGPPDGMGSEAHFALNPFGKIPVLQVDGASIIESAAIQEYLEDRYPELSLRGADPAQTAAVRAFVRAVDLYLFPALFGLRGLPPGQVEALDRAVAEIDAVVDRLSRLHVGPYLCGQHLTLADCTLVPACFYTNLFAGRLGFASPFERHVWFPAWWDQINGHDSVRHVVTGLSALAQATKAVSSE